MVGKKVKRNNSEIQQNVPQSPTNFFNKQPDTYTPPSPLWGVNCFTAPSQLSNWSTRAPRARSKSASLISEESEAQCWACLLQAINTVSQEVLPVSVLTVPCPSVSLVLWFCCALASSHSDQRLLPPEKQERPASQNSCPFFCLYISIPHIPSSLLNAQTAYCSSRKRNIPVPYKYFSA